MYIEKKSSDEYLAKKIFSKRILLRIWEKEISIDNIKKFTWKEISFFQTLDSYQDFTQQLYNLNSFVDILLYSKYLSNILESQDVKSYTSEFLNIQAKKLVDFLWEDFPKLFIYNSNNIEGSKIAYSEVEKIIENKKYSHKVVNEIREVENSFATFKYLQSDFLFNHTHIKRLYHMLTKSLLQENGEKYPRWYKKMKNTVNNSQTSSPKNVEKDIGDLLEFYRNNKKTIFPLQLAFDFHLRYEQIHPFQNGNGRTGRMIMNKILMQNGFFPMIVFTDNKQAYSNAIKSCEKGNKKKYYKFMLEQYKKTLDLVDIDYPDGGDILQFLIIKNNNK